MTSVSIECFTEIRFVIWIDALTIARKLWRLKIEYFMLSRAQIILEINLVRDV